jgi:hypothetical protein
MAFEAFFVVNAARQIMAPNTFGDGVPVGVRFGKITRGD